MLQTLVTGGTGFVGSAVVRQLVAQRETVHVLTRNPASVPRQRRVSGAHYIEGDVLEFASLSKALQGCDAIVHCVQFPGAPFENPAKGWTYANVDGQGTENLALAAKDHGIKRLIYVSGAGAGQGRSESWFQAKDRAEKAVQNTGEAWTVLRPSWMYGPGDQSLSRLIMVSKLPLFFPIIGAGNQSIAPLYIEDFARVVGYMLNRDGFYQKTLELGGPKILTFNQMMLQMLQVLQKKRILMHMSPCIPLFIASIVSMLNLNPFITKDGIDFICMDVDIDVSKAHAYFDFVFTDFQKGLQKYL